MGPSRDARVCSSKMLVILMARPSVVASKQKSIAHTSFGAAATGADLACRFLALAAAPHRHA